MADKKDKPDKAEQAAKAEQTAKSDAAAKAKREGKARQAQQKQAAEEAKASAAAPLPPEPKLPARLRVRFENEIAPALMKELKIDNKMRVPRLAEDHDQHGAAGSARQRQDSRLGARRAEGHQPGRSRC